MRAGGLLVVLTLITSCFVGGTFAKYVTENEGMDTARVAKWGVEVTVTGDGFKTSYGKDYAESNVEGNTVISSTGEKVVAPGTKGTFGGVKIPGNPEVAVKIEPTADVDLSGWNVGRLGAQGLYNICTPTSSPKPGDLVFFKGTYDTPGVSHCGIYVGDGKMLHCGDPIGYANLNTSYWQSHFYAYGRLP